MFCFFDFMFLQSLDLNFACSGFHCQRKVQKTLLSSVVGFNKSTGANRVDKSLSLRFVDKSTLS